MPHPISTPTQAGITAPFVATTEPTVAPFPRCTSGIAATCLNTQGRFAVLTSWSMAEDSTSWIGAHTLMGTLALFRTEIMLPPASTHHASFVSLHSFNHSLLH